MQLFVFAILLFVFVGLGLVASAAFVAGVYLVTLYGMVGMIIAAAAMVVVLS